MLVGDIRLDIGDAHECAVDEERVGPGGDRAVLERHVFVDGAVVPVGVRRRVEGRLLKVRRRVPVVGQAVLVAVGLEGRELGRARHRVVHALLPCRQRAWGDAEILGHLLVKGVAIGDGLERGLRVREVRAREQGQIVLADLEVDRRALVLGHDRALELGHVAALVREPIALLHAEHEPTRNLGVGIARIDHAIAIAQHLIDIDAVRGRRVHVLLQVGRHRVGVHGFPVVGLFGLGLPHAVAVRVVEPIHLVAIAIRRARVEQHAQVIVDARSRARHKFGRLPFEGRAERQGVREHHLAVLVRIESADEQIEVIDVAILGRVELVAGFAINLRDARALHRVIHSQAIVEIRVVRGEPGAERLDVIIKRGIDAIKIRLHDERIAVFLVDVGVHRAKVAIDHHVLADHDAAGSHDGRIDALHHPEVLRDGALDGLAVAVVREVVARHADADIGAVGEWLVGHLERGLRVTGRAEHERALREDGARGRARKRRILDAVKRLVARVRDAFVLVVDLDQRIAHAGHGARTGIGIALWRVDVHRAERAAVRPRPELIGEDLIDLAALNNESAHGLGQTRLGNTEARLGRAKRAVDVLVRGRRHDVALAHDRHRRCERPEKNQEHHRDHRHHAAARRLPRALRERSGRTLLVGTA